jgi:hypothetical protein
LQQVHTKTNHLKLQARHLIVLLQVDLIHSPTKRILTQEPIPLFVFEVNPDNFRQFIRERSLIAVSPSPS